MMKLIHTMLTPNAYFFLFSILLIIWSVFNWRYLKTMVILCATLFLVVSSPLSAVSLKALEKVHPVVAAPIHKKAAVVLAGHNVFREKSRNLYVFGRTAARVLEAVRLYRNGIVDTLLLSGGNPNDVVQGLDDEGISALQFAMEMGVPRQAVVVKKWVNNTYEEAKSLKHILLDLGIEDFYLVTSAFHMQRAMKVFEKQGLKPVAFPVDHQIRDNESMPFWKMTNVDYFGLLLHEYIGLIVYGIRDII